MLAFARTVGEMVFAEQAAKIWALEYRGLSTGKPGLFGAVVSRAEAQARRLACLYTLAEKSSRIEGGHLESALALWRSCEQSARYIFGDKLGDPDADAILSAVRSAGAAGLTRTALNDLFKGHRSSAVLNRALLLLGDTGLVRRAEESTGGRPVERWFIS